MCSARFQAILAVRTDLACRSILRHRLRRPECRDTTRHRPTDGTKDSPHSPTGRRPACRPTALAPRQTRDEGPNPQGVRGVWVRRIGRCRCLCRRACATLDRDGPPVRGRQPATNETEPTRTARAHRQDRKAPKAQVPRLPRPNRSGLFAPASVGEMCLDVGTGARRPSTRASNRHWLLRSLQNETSAQHNKDDAGDSIDGSRRSCVHCSGVLVRQHERNRSVPGDGDDGDRQDDEKAR